jgi:hypothetical protein
MVNKGSARKRQVVKASADGAECAICLDVLSSSECLELPCGHGHQPCVQRLREFGVNDARPECRAPLPPGPMVKFEDVVGCSACGGSRRAATNDARLRRWRFAEAAALARLAGACRGQLDGACSSYVGLFA